MNASPCSAQPRPLVAPQRPPAGSISTSPAEVAPLATDGYVASSADGPTAISIYDGTRLALVGDGGTPCPIGVDLGRNFFLDLDGNLSYLVAPDLLVKGPSHVEYRVSGRLQGQVDEAPGGARVSRLVGGRLQTWTISEKGEDTILIPPYPGVRTTIHRAGNETVIFEGSREAARIIDDGQRAQVLEGGTRRTFIDRSGNTTTIRGTGRGVTWIREEDGFTEARSADGSILRVGRQDENHIQVDHLGSGSPERAYISRKGSDVEVRGSALGNAVITISGR